MMSIRANLDSETMEVLSFFLKENADLFSRKLTNISGIDPNLFYHKLVVNPSLKPVCQRSRKMAPKLLQEIERQVKQLHEVGFIKEIMYTTWLANVVPVNKHCSKDAYLFPDIDKLVYKSSSYRYLSFIDSYSGYNQIPLHLNDQEKITFMIKRAYYCYKVMSFELKNIKAKYKRMMNRVFQKQIGQDL